MSVVKFPSWRYHKTEAPKLVHNPDEDKALGDGWEDSPAAFDKKPEAKPVPKAAEPVKLPEPPKAEPAKFPEPQKQQPQQSEPAKLNLHLPAPPSPPIKK